MSTRVPFESFFSFAFVCFAHIWLYIPFAANSSSWFPFSTICPRCKTIIWSALVMVERR